MDTREKLTSAGAAAFIAASNGWTVAGEALEKTYSFQYYGAAIAFAVHLGFAAEKRDHHPDLYISWGKVRVRWTTHDAGGVTAIDVEMAELSDHAYRR